MSSDAYPDSQDGSRLLGLNRNLWKLAVFTAMAQFSLSLWNWQFGIHIETVLEPWQMGLTFTAGTGCSIAGSPSAGIISDMIGRKKTISLALVPMTAGLLLLHSFPVWPVIPVAYGITMFGWSFVLVMTRAFPADDLVASGGQNSARKFAMVFMPAFLMDGAAPLIAAAILEAGYQPPTLYLVAGCMGIVTMFAILIGLRESLSEEIRAKARSGPKITFRGLGWNYWVFVLSMLPFYFSFNMAIPYFGNLCVDEWNVSTTVYAMTWSTFSFTYALISYHASGLADKSHSKALLVALASNALIIGAYAFGSGVVLMFILEVLWAAPLAVWIGTENTFVVRDVDDDKQGRAPGTYDVMMQSTGLFAANAGAFIWALTGSLRVLYLAASVVGVLAVVVVSIALRNISRHRRQPAQQPLDSP